MTPAEIVDDREGLGAARPRRRRLPDRPEVVVHEARRRQAALPLLQRRRVRARHVQGSRDHAVDAARAGRGLRDRRVRDRRRDGVHLHPRRVHRAARARWSAPCEEAYAAGILGTNAMGTGKTRRRLRAQGRRRVHLRRRDGAHELARGAPRQSAHQAAVPGGRGRVRQPTTINNVETLAAVPHILNNGAEWYKKFGRARQPEEHRHEALVGVRQHRSGRATTKSRWDSRSRTSCTTSAAVRCPAGKFKAVIPGGISVPIHDAGGSRSRRHGLRGVRRRRARCSAPAA